MNVYIVTEGTDDEAILKAVLSDSTKNQDNYRIVSAGRQSSAESYARSLLATGKGPVALVVASDTIEEWRSSELESSLNRSLSEVSSSFPFKVFVIRPEIESLLFRDIELVRDIVGFIDDSDFIKGEFMPREVLAKLMNGRQLKTAIQASSVSKKLANLHLTELDNLRSFVQNALPA